MKTPSRKEAAALARLDAAVDGESIREEIWHLTPIVERERAVSVAGLPRERAAMPLATFSDAERERIRAAVAYHTAMMEAVMRCMVMRQTNRLGYLH